MFLKDCYLLPSTTLAAHPGTYHSLCKENTSCKSPSHLKPMPLVFRIFTWEKYSDYPPYLDLVKILCTFKLPLSLQNFREKKNKFVQLLPMTLSRWTSSRSLDIGADLDHSAHRIYSAFNHVWSISPLNPILLPCPASFDSHPNQEPINLRFEDT